MSPLDKPLVWLKGEVKTPPLGDAARIEAGFLLRRLQRGEVLAFSMRAGSEWRCTRRSRKDREMRAERKRQLERAGWVVGDAGDFLGLSADERRFIEAKLALADGLRRRRESLGLTQSALAERLGSSQSRVAKMEAAHRTVSTDLLLKSLFQLGAGPADIARLLTTRARTHAA